MKVKLRVIAILIAIMLVFPLSVHAADKDLKDTGLLWLVNRDHSIPEDYVPEGMVSLKGYSGLKMLPEAAEAYSLMMAGIKEAEIKAPIPFSSYRSYSRQEYLFTTRLNTRVAQGMSYTNAFNRTANSTAYPGTSEHQTGLALDISANGGTSSSFANAESGKWMKANSWRYGYILRYEGEKTDLTNIMSEPWHFRYVGIPHAQIMYENDWCFEEYVQQLKKGKEFTCKADDGSEWQVWYQKNNKRIDSTVTSYSSDNAGGYIFTAMTTAPEVTPAPMPTPAPIPKKTTVEYEEGPIPGIINLYNSVRNSISSWFE